MEQRKGVVLVIEDDYGIREAIREFLEMEGFRVVVACNGKEGIELLSEIQSPCLIILDFFMPVMDGSEFLQELQSRPQFQQNKVFSIPIALLSAAMPNSSAIAAAKPLVSAYLKKPVDLEGFLNTVKQYCVGEDAA